MRNLALETTERIGSLAVLEGDKLVADRQLPTDQRTAATFAVGVQELLAEVSWQPTDLELISVCAGPGSFTGLRIGITAAKTLAYVTGADVVGVNTLEVIALGAKHKPDGDADSEVATRRLWAVMDAFRGQLFAAQFELSGDELTSGSLKTVIEPHIVDVDEWTAGLQAGDVVTGPVLTKVQDQLPEHVTACDPECWAPSAEFVGRWGYLQYQTGQRDDLWQLVPNYYRKSAAEEKADAESVD